MQPWLAITWRQSQTAPRTWCGFRRRSRVLGTVILGTPCWAPASTVGVVRSPGAERRRPRRRRFLRLPPASSSFAECEAVGCFFAIAAGASPVTSYTSILPQKFEKVKKVPKRHVTRHCQLLSRADDRRRRATARWLIQMKVGDN